MEPVIVYEDEQASIVYGQHPAALGHLKVYPKPKAKSLQDLPAKQISHLFMLATRCASLLFDGLQAQGTNIILNDGKNANQQDENICVDIIARAENDGLKFNWDFKQGDYNAVKQVASDIASKIVVYEAPAQAGSPAASATQTIVLDPAPAKVLEKAERIEPQPPVSIVEKKSEEKKAEEVMAQREPPKPVGVEEKKIVIPNAPPAEITANVAKQPTAKVTEPKETKPAPYDPKKDEQFDPKKNFLYYELMRLP